MLIFEFVCRGVLVFVGLGLDSTETCTRAQLVLDHFYLLLYLLRPQHNISWSRVEHAFYDEEVLNSYWVWCTYNIFWHTDIHWNTYKYLSLYLSKFCKLRILSLIKQYYYTNASHESIFAQVLLASNNTVLPTVRKLS